MTALQYRFDSTWLSSGMSTDMFDMHIQDCDRWFAQNQTYIRSKNNVKKSCKLLCESPIRTVRRCAAWLLSQRGQQRWGRAVGRHLIGLYVPQARLQCPSICRMAG